MVTLVFLIPFSSTDCILSANFLLHVIDFMMHKAYLKQVGAKMGKTTQPVYWGRTVITGHTVVEDMLD